ncbi:hypothetical protein ZWY2020_027448 [Hordeum vulgare]|nr:hypothetical protein ZWY2020_058086 [Hordeum vulgare]KAI5002798.1 hypothetical protein ZWY2020_027448 [Hordeum vulgare]
MPDGPVARAGPAPPVSSWGPVAVPVHARHLTNPRAPSDVASLGTDMRVQEELRPAVSEVVEEDECRFEPSRWVEAMMGVPDRAKGGKEKLHASSAESWPHRLVDWALSVP